MLHLGDVQVDFAALALCRQYQVRELLVFGSAVRDEMRPDIDIDLLKVDLVSKKALKPLIRRSVLEGAHVVYAAHLDPIKGRRDEFLRSLEDARASLKRGEGRAITPESMRQLAAEIKERGRARLKAQL
jgi:hypothetical protein